MAYETFQLDGGIVRVKCSHGVFVHYRWNFEKDTWTVDENPERQEFRNESEALNRARVIAGDPDFDQ
jgi:hypothetical protein